jgi:hypothetical protein
MAPIDLNFNTDNLIIICYPDYAGGNFVMNSLGLSDFATFALPSLVDQQLAGKFGSLDKLNYLTGKVMSESTTGGWSDMHLSAGMLANSIFGMLSHTHSMAGPMGMVPKEVLPTFLFSNTLANVVDNKLKFFLGVHHPMQVSYALGIWPNAKIIVFDNYRPFLKFRRRHRSHEAILQPHWNDIRGDSWPTVAPANLEEFEELAENIKQEIVTDFSDFYRILVAVDAWRIRFFENYDQEINQYRNNPNAVIWDTDNYFSEEKTLTGMKDLYRHFNLPDFNHQAVSTYYQSWFNKIQQIRDIK